MTGKIIEFIHLKADHLGFFYLGVNKLITDKTQGIFIWWLDILTSMKYTF